MGTTSANGQRAGTWRRRSMSVSLSALMAMAWVVVTPSRADAAGPDTQAYIEAAYQVFLGRGASAADVDRWDTTVDRGDRASFTAALAESDEWAGVRIDELYQKILRRSADADGRANWLRRVREGLRLEDIAAFFYGSEEYFNRVGRTFEGYVDNLYADLLGRPADAGGRNYWVERLRSGLSRTDAALNFYASTESRNDRVADLYQEILDRPPDAAGQAHWAQRLTTLGDVALAASLATSDEFYLKATGFTPPLPGMIRLRGTEGRTFRVDLLGPTIVRARHTGSRNFIIEFQDGNGDFDGLGANEIGDYSGERYHGRWQDTRFVEVTADGTWSAELLPLLYATLMDVGNGNANGDQFRRVSLSSARLTTFTHDGSRNFIVTAYDANGQYNGLVVNEIGNVNTQRVIPAGTEYLEIQADGAWTTR